MTTPPDDLRARLAGLTLEDEHRLRRRLDGTRKTRDAEARARQRARIATDVAAAEERIARRRAAVPTVRYPAELPVSARREDIAAALRDHQVVVVAGETGSGKTTQLPKIALELGRGVTGRIGHTQPRRIAARTVAERIAEELETPLGEVVGWKVRFTDQVGDTTLVKVMTDGVLLAEIGRDRLLRQYDTLIIDEAHERSLNIDFLLGYLARLLPRRPDLKLVITSATIDVERVAKHFSADGAEVPVVEVSGRTYPVEVRYRPVVDPDGRAGDDTADPDRDQVTAIADAVDELAAEGPGDVLVFLAGEREIRDTADVLTERFPSVEVLPLYSRLSAADQHRVFQRHPGRRIVLATNVAETSLTVPGIRYVVDPGTARISRYSSRLKVQRLPIEPISQASARQRSGRCGRTSEGIAIRLYTEEDFESRPEYTDPEILRTNLASVLLQMAALDLGDVADFPFIDPPDRRAVADGVALLEELGALDDAGALTPTGRALATLPLDPRMARMVVEADRRGVLEEVLVIAAGLTIQDPRERPGEHQQAADTAHARFADEHSDFLALLNLWRYVTEQQDALSGSQFRRTLKREFLHYLRIREWQDLYGQLRSTARRLGMTVGEPATEPDERGISAAVLSGLLSHVGLQVEDAKTNRGRGREYLGARNARFVLAPGTPLAKKPPRWVVAAELVETSRLFARTVARIDPEVVERLAEHLVKRQYSEPRWDAKRGSVVATERVTLYGIPLVVGRRVQYGSIDPVVSRELFIRHALVEGDWTTHHRFWRDNQKAMQRVAELEERARRRDIRVDDETLFDLYDARIPADVVSTRHFDRWWKAARRETPDLLTFPPEMLTNAAAAGQVRVEDFPDEVPLTHGLTLPLSYAFAPGTPADGVTVDVPLAVLDTVAERTSGESLAFTVPGLREELVTALLRTLPKQLRRTLVPIPDRVREVLPRIAPTEPLLPALERELRRAAGVVVPPDAWAPDQVPDHLRATFRVVDDRHRPLATGKDLQALRREVAPQSRASLAAAASDVERTGQTAWTFGTLPRTVEVRRGGHVGTAYPALVDEGTTVGVRVVATEVEATRLTWRGARRLLVLVAGSPTRQVAKSLSPRSRLALQFNPDGEIPALVDDCVDAAADELLSAAGGPPRDEAAFAALVQTARAQLLPLTTDTVRRVEAVLVQAREVAVAIGAAPGRRVPEAAVADLRRQMGGLLHRGFVAAAGRRRLPDLVRYLRGMVHRLEKLPANAVRDELWMRQVAAVTAEYEQLRTQVPSTGAPDDPVARVRWMIEELRVSLFAQTVGTPRPVSEQRVYRAIDAL
ncbi:ATP-dependent helicase HrpA [Geodermatophilus obscurus]|uniref:RNA helicase n=1 Tax=Geodermatophilus obscurus TaxID=1861 RepID=A0A1M7UZ73_9ACTN|nr:ATP-dependent RNA helicase HrpA [Geodermatophilus obscurus]SHN88303.1 ATP-dependent helicase HrpA [Geodermatophilus obscurus]